MNLVDIFFGKIIEKRINDYQNDLITKHCDEVENMYRQMRGWRHDYHNHIQTIKAYISLGEIDKVGEYLGSLETDLTQIDSIVKTGNVMVDAILNSKLSLIKAKNIPVNAKVTVPPNLATSEIDLCVIIGNLLDNAIEASQKFEDKNKALIRIYVGILKGQLYISVVNYVCGDIKKQGKKYISSKNNETHGFGLMRIDGIVKKYNGFINRQNEDGVFATEIMLPL
ncbi:MAG: GHKL domain-containing protein [Oscillospiraceae bacterium]